jgi:hypothetical protein
MPLDAVRLLEPEFVGNRPPVLIRRPRRTTLSASLTPHDVMKLNGQDPDPGVSFVEHLGRVAAV